MLVINGNVQNKNHIAMVGQSTKKTSAEALVFLPATIFELPDFSIKRSS